MTGLDYVEDYLRHLYEGLTQGHPSVLEGPWFSRQGQGSIFLDKEDAAAHFQVLERLMKEHARREDISRRTVEGYLQDALFSALVPKIERRDERAFEARLSSAMRELGQRLRELPAQYTCYVPVLGMGDDGLPLTWGGVRFVRMTQTRLRRLALPAGRDRSGDTERHRRIFLRDMREEGLVGKPMAMVQVMARDSAAAESLARRKTREVVDILNFFADLIPNSPGWLYMPGEAASEGTLTPCVWPDGGLGLSSALEGPFPQMSMRRLKSTPALRPSLDRVRQVLQESPRSSLSELLITSLRWAGRGVTEPVREREFLDYAIAIETLVVPDQDVELAYRLRLRAAHLLSSSIEGREQVIRSLSRLYEIRSRIVHSGSFEVVDKDLRDLRYLAKSVIIRVLLHRSVRHMKTKDEYVSWLTRQALK